MHHKDSDGNNLGIHNKHFMLMKAGSGIYHEEGVPEGEETVGKGDSIVIKEEPFDLLSRDDSDLVFFVLDEEAPFCRNGLFAK